MSKREDQSFTDEAVTYGDTTRGNDQIPVVDDNKYGAEGLDAMDDQVKDSDAQLGIYPVKESDWYLERDDKEAIDKSNIIKGDRLRHAKPVGGKYQEKEEDDLPSEAQ